MIRGLQADSPADHAAISAAVLLLEVNFARLLQELLHQHNCSRKELYEYIFLHGCHIDQTAMYRYFNANARTTRLPGGTKGRLFLDLFCTFLKLSDAERAALLLIWHIQRRQRRKNSPERIAMGNTDEWQDHG